MIIFINKSWRSGFRGFSVQAYKRVLSSFLLYGTLATIVAGAFYFLVPKFEKRAMLEEQRKDLMQKIDEKKKEIEALKTMQERFVNDAAFVEYVARQNKRINKNEFLFVYENE